MTGTLNALRSSWDAVANPGLYQPKPLPLPGAPSTRDALGAAYDQAAGVEDFAPTLQAIGTKHKALAPHLGNFMVQRGPDPGDGRQLESYPPNEDWNPNPGKYTVELYKGQKGADLENAIVGDSFHHLGGIDPTTGQPIDPTWRGFKDQYRQSLTPEQIAMDQRAYAAAQQQGETRPHDDWWDQSRGDEHFMGYLTPDQQDDWRGSYSPEQVALLNKARGYLTSGKP